MKDSNPPLQREVGSPAQPNQISLPNTEIFNPTDVHAKLCKLFGLKADSHLEPLAPFVVGPSGGRGGKNFTTGVFSGEAVLRRIYVRHGEIIRAVGVRYEISSRQVGCDLPLHGGSGDALDFVELQPGEEVTRVSGRYGKCVDSMIIHTSHGQLRAFGGSGGTAAYDYTTPAGFEFCGFGGKSSGVLDSVGPMFRRSAKPLENSGPVVQGPAGDHHGTAFNLSSIPTGGRVTGVEVWLDRLVPLGPSRPRTAIRGIGLLRHDESGVPQRQFHGRAEGKLKKFDLQEDEYIVSLTGCHRRAVRGIRIITNKRISDPLGLENVGIPFTFKTNPLDCPNPAAFEVIGLCGFADDWIRALGVYYRPRIAA